MAKNEDDEDVSDIDVDGEEEDEAESNSLSNSEVVTKYRTAGDIANKVLAKLISDVKPGVKAVDLCAAGDAFIEAETGKIYNNKKTAEGKPIPKGIAFPTCISVNSCVGHYSPLLSTTSVELGEGDVVKIDLGVHVDGYIATVASTAYCTANADTPATGRKADVMQAAYVAAECAQRMYKEGATNYEITEMISKIADTYKCNAVEGVLSHQMKKHVIDANKVMINKPTSEQQVAEAKIEKDDVFAIDIVMSTGDGKPRPGDDRTTVYKRNLEEKYALKMKASRQFFSEVNAKFPTMPFTLRAGEEKVWRLGVTECVKHDLFIEYPVLFDKPDEFVAQYKFTVLLLPSGNAARITTGPAPSAKSEFEVEDEGLKELLAQSTEKKKKTKKKKKAGAKDGDKEDA